MKIKNILFVSIRCRIVLLSKEDNMYILPFGPVEICGTERHDVPDKVGGVGS